MKWPLVLDFVGKKPQLAKIIQTGIKNFAHIVSNRNNKVIYPAPQNNCSVKENKTFFFYFFFFNKHQSSGAKTRQIKPYDLGLVSEELKKKKKKKSSEPGVSHCGSYLVEGNYFPCDSIKADLLSFNWKNIDGMQKAHSPKYISLSQL